MALLNRRLKDKPTDEIALLIEPQKVVLMDVEDDEDEDSVAEETFNHHGITLWVSDAVILIIQHLQIFALILAMSERWGYPFDFIKHVYYVFLINLDVWEFVKVNSGAYTGSTTSYVKSASLPFGYQPYFMAWAVLFFVTCLAFLGTYIHLKVKRPLYLLLHVARLKRVFCVAAQLGCLPVGIVIARVFHCHTDQSNALVWNVDNNVQCWTMPHYVYVAVAMVIAVMVFVVYPINLIRKTRGQVISFDPEKHEGYLQLKESEYNQGLDILWAVGQFHLFSSFRRMWIYYRPIIFYLKFFLLCFYSGLTFYPTSSFSLKLALNVSIAGLFVIIVFVMLTSSVAKPPISRFRAYILWFIWKAIKELVMLVFSVKLDILLPKFFLVLVAFGAYTLDISGGGMGFLLSLLIIIMLRSPPFRVTPFNFMIVFCFLVNAGNAYFGCVIEQNRLSSDAVNSLVVHPYPYYALVTLNSIWLAVAIGWVIYLLLRYFQVVGFKKPLWPTLSRDGISDMDKETKKYMRAVLRGRHILEKALSSTPIFAPVHEIERQIHVINAYCREAEYLEDPTFESLWDLLDELIEAHRALSPLSMFSQSVKKSVRETAKEFMKLMPQMRKRLDQREHDFILMDPVKKRMLLKMYVLGAFVNGRCDKIRYEVEKKVHKSLEKAAVRPLSTFSSGTSVDWDSIYGTKDHYDTDMYGTTSSSGSRPGTSYTSRVDSVDKLLDEVDTWEEGHKPNNDVKAHSVGSLRSTQESSSAKESSPSGNNL